MMVIENLNNTSEYQGNLKRCKSYVHALEEERRKIQVFERELPLCLELVTQAIETCKRQLHSEGDYNFHGQSDCSEQTSSDEGPVLEEFIPLKISPNCENDKEQSRKRSNRDGHHDEILTKDKKSSENKASKKTDWLRSAQLWNQTPDPTPKEDSPKKVKVVEVKRHGGAGAFHPFKTIEKSVGTTSTTEQGPCTGGGRGGVGGKSVPTTATSSSIETGGGSGGAGRGGGDGTGKSKKVDKEGQSQKKQRRCWSPELHRKFLQVLQQLRGPQVATPKQIRELMKVDGLTNDEVKSHLQKYRLHARRPPSSIHTTSTNTTTQAPHIVVVGGMWAPPHLEYATITTSTASVIEPPAAGAPNSGSIYAPIAALPPAIRDKPSRSNSGGGGGGDGDAVRADSPAFSSSDTTTASPPPAY